MSTSGKKKPPLRAEARHAPRKSAKRRKPATKQRGLFARLFGFLFRVFFGIFWRAGVVFALILAMVTGYYFTTLPSVSALVDGREGSVVK